MGSTRRSAAILLASTALIACSQDDSPVTSGPAPPASAARSAATSPTTVPPALDPSPPAESNAITAAAAAPTTTPAGWIEVADDRLAFTLALPDEHRVINALVSDPTGDGACTAPLWQLEGGINIEAWPANCDPINADPGNGSYGHYRSSADAPAPLRPVEVDTVLGPGEVFGQVYYETTNALDEWELDVAVITLSEPVNDNYPALTVIGTAKGFTRDDLLALLGSFGAG